MLVTKDVVVVGVGIGGAAIGDIMGSTAATMAEEAGMSGMFVTTVRIITSFTGAFVIRAMITVMSGLVCGPGGSAPLLTEGHHCYDAPLPDDSGLARQLAH